MCVHELQQANFNLCLVQERLFVFDDFYGDVFFLLMIVSFTNLQKNFRVNRVGFSIKIISFVHDLKNADTLLRKPKELIR